MTSRAVGVMAAALLVAAGATARDIPVPYLSGRVVDEAEVLRPETRWSVAAQLQEHERRTGAQVVVLTVRTLGDASVEDYAAAVFKAWGLGRKGQDDGVLLVVAPSERRMRIEVGYGLEEKLPDIAAARILRNVVTPRFREGDLDRGVTEGVAAILDQLEGRAAPAADDGAAPVAVAERRASGLHLDGPDLPLTERILFGAFVFGIIGLFTVIGVLTPGAGWFLYFFLIPFWAMFPIVVVGTRGALVLLGTYVVAFPVAKVLASRQPWYARARRDLATKGTAQVGGFTLTSGGGASWSSGSSSGGGFSGGGGSSGGGGASGSW